MQWEYNIITNQQSCKYSVRLMAIIGGLTPFLLENYSSITRHILNDWETWATLGQWLKHGQWLDSQASTWERGNHGGKLI